MTNQSVKSVQSVDKPKRRVSEKRLAKLIARAHGLGHRATVLYIKSKELIELAIACGLELGKPILINGEEWRVIKPKGKWVDFAAFKLEKVPKFERAKQEKIAQSSAHSIAQ